MSSVYTSKYYPVSSSKVWARVYCKFDYDDTVNSSGYINIYNLKIYHEFCCAGAGSSYKWNFNSTTASFNGTEKTKSGYSGYYCDNAGVLEAYLTLFGTFSVYVGKSGGRLCVDIWNDQVKYLVSGKNYGSSDIDASAQYSIKAYPVTKYTITLECKIKGTDTIGGGYITASSSSTSSIPSATYEEGDHFTFYAKAYTGFSFDHWEVSSSSYTTRDNPPSVGYADQNETWTAYFKDNRTYYDIKTAVNDSSAGTATGGGSKLEGSQVTLTATVTDTTNYYWSHWTLPNGNTKSDNPLQFYPETYGAGTYTANFKSKLVKVVVSNGTGGVVYCENLTTGKKGTTVDGYMGHKFRFYTYSLTAGYYLSSFKDWNGVERNVFDYRPTITTNGTYTVTAAYSRKSYTLSASGDDGVNSITGTGSVVYGATRQLTASIKGGHTFYYWLCEDTDTKYWTNPVTVTMPASDRTFSCHTYLNVYTIDTEVSPSGTGYVDGGDDYTYGSEATLTAHAYLGYAFKKWSDGNTDNPRTVTVSSNKTYTAEFRSTAVTVNTSYNTGGTLQVANHTRTPNTWSTSATGYEGDEFQFEITQDTGYHWESTEDKSGNYYASTFTKKITSSGTYTFTGTFKINSYQLSLVAGTSGFTALTGAGSFVYHSTRPIEATVDPHYTWMYWMDEGGNKYHDNPLPVVMPAKDVTYTAYAIAKRFTITGEFDPVGGGYIEGLGTYNYQEEILLTAVANEGYEFKCWEDGSKDPERTLIVTGDKTVTAYFGDGVVISTNVSPSDGGTVTGGGKYSPNKTITLTATPNEAYVFVSWNDGNTDATRQIVTQASTTYTAYFELKEFYVDTEAYPEHAGYVDGADTYVYGEKCYLTAYPTELHRFVNWDNGSSANPMKFRVYDDEFFTAIFERWCDIYVGDNRVTEIFIGDTSLEEVLLGDTKMYLK